MLTCRLMLHVSQYLWSFEDSRSEQAPWYREAGQPHYNKQEGLHWYSKYRYWPMGRCVLRKSRDFYMEAATKESLVLASSSPQTNILRLCHTFLWHCHVWFSSQLPVYLPTSPDSLQQRDAWKLNQSAALPQSFLLFVEEPGGGS